MELNILSFVKKLIPSLDKNETLSDFELSMKALDEVNSVMGYLKNYEKTVGFSSKKSKAILDKLSNEIVSAIKAAHDTKSPMLKLLNQSLPCDMMGYLFTNVSLNAKTLYKEIEEKLSKTVLTHQLDAYEANLLRSVAHYRFMTKYALNLADYLFINEDSNNISNFTPQQIKEIEKYYWIFAKCLAGYGVTPEIFEERLSSIEPVTLSKDGEEIISTVYAGSGRVDLIEGLPRGFIGSPIYNVRLVFAQWEAERYHELKDKKKLLLLRYQYLLDLNQKGTSDIEVEREIEYLQNKINKIDYRLSKIEESVE